MKSSVTSNSVFYANVGKPARPPLRTFREFAQEFGVTDAKLAAALKEPGSPKPELLQQNKRTTNNRWYKVREMRKWWSERAAK